MNDCQCNIPDGGYCERHLMRKTKHLVNLCRTNEGYFKIWEDSRNRWTLSKSSRGLGDTIAKLTHATGIDRVANFVAHGDTKKPCGGCGQRQGILNQLVPYRRDAPTTRHLIYHVYASRDNNHWLRNLEQLKRRWDVFNGKKVVAISNGDGTHAPEGVKAVIDDTSVEYLVLDNDPELRETATLLPLLMAIKTEANDAVFYAHTKGVANSEKKKYDIKTGIMLWRNSMYHHLLDDVPTAMEALRDHPMVGCCIGSWGRRDKSPYPTKLSVGNWMFCGTFFWFSAMAVFSHHRWPLIANDRYGAEAWPSSLFTRKAVKSLFQPWPENTMPQKSPYHPMYYDPKFLDEQQGG